MAIAEVSQKNSFADADGILGLAFHQLNHGHNLAQYLSEKKVNPKKTFPWKTTEIKETSIKEFDQFLNKNPRECIKPYFTQLEEEAICPNRFSFIASRSSIHHVSKNLTPDELKQDPLNQGLFLLGAGVEETDLHHGEFERIRVIDDVYYNVRLLKIRVGEFEAFDVPKLKGKELERHHSNAFIDTGASLIVLDNTVFNYVIDCFEKINPEFKMLLEPFLSFEGVEEGINLNKINLSQWTDIEFIFEAAVDSDKKEVSWFCKPNDYWQVNAPSYGQASFKLLSQLPGWPDQSILGLPLLTNYYVVFARFENEFGDIKFARAK